jgi:hypothetical protein
MSKKLITEVPDELYEAVQAQVKKEERSQAQIVRRALRRYLGLGEGREVTTGTLTWEGQELVTYGDIGKAIDRIIENGTTEDARRFMEAYEGVNSNARANVGYLAGYYGAEKMKKILDWFDCSHPMFGRIIPTPEAALKAGERFATQSKAEEQ